MNHWGTTHTHDAAEADAPPRSDEDKLQSGADAATGRFEWHHADCGTIYADTLDDAIQAAFDRLSVHDAATANQKCANVSRVGFNLTPADWKPGA